MKSYSLGLTKNAGIGKGLPVHNCFEVLGNSLRFNIIGLLLEREMPVLEIAERLNAEQSRVSHALQILRDCHLIEMKRKGKQKIYFVPKNINEIFDLKKAGRQLKAESMFDLLNIHANANCTGCYREEQKKKAKFKVKLK